MNKISDYENYIGACKDIETLGREELECLAELMKEIGSKYYRKCNDEKECIINTPGVSSSIERLGRYESIRNALCWVVFAALLPHVSQKDYSRTGNEEGGRAARLLEKKESLVIWCEMQKKGIRTMSQRLRAQKKEKRLRLSIGTLS